MAKDISEHKSLMAGAGVSILTTIAGIFSTYLRAHPAWLVAGAVVGVALLVWPLIHSLWIGRKKPEALAANSGIQAGRDKSGHQMHAGKDVVSSPQIGHVHGDVRFESRHEPVPAPLPHSEVKIPQLVIRSPRHVCLANESKMLTLADNGEPGMVVTVENPEAEVGRQGIKAQGIVAIIRFSRNGHLSATSEYACWLGTYENRINLEPGTSRVLVVGTYSNPKVWRCYTSTIDDPLPQPRSWGAVQSLTRRIQDPLDPQLLLFNPTIDAQITLISKRDRYTLAQKTYRLSTTETVAGETGAFVFEELP